MKKNWFFVVLAVVFLFGLCLALYPLFSHYLSNQGQARLIVSYENNNEGVEIQKQKSLLEEARAYNKELSEEGIDWHLSYSEKKEYEKLLKMTNSEIMSYIEIPAIDCSLPVYHGTENETLQVGAGHLMGSSLPVGGEGSHCVIVGHRGLPGATLFTDLDKLSEGDIFYLTTLNETLAYEVDQIRIVEPEDFSYLQIEEGMDLCTLVTCTPKDVNTHRLLVRGHRINTLEENTHIANEADIKNKDVVALVISIPLLFVTLLLMYIKNRTLYRKRKVIENHN